MPVRPRQALPVKCPLHFLQMRCPPRGNYWSVGFLFTNFFLFPDMMFWTFSNKSSETIASWRPTTIYAGLSRYEATNILPV